LSSLGRPAAWRCHASVASLLRLAIGPFSLVLIFRGDVNNSRFGHVFRCGRIEGTDPEGNMNRKPGNVSNRIAAALGAAALAAAVMAAPATAGEGRAHGERGGHCGPRMLRHALSQVDLSEAQKEKIRELVEARKSKMQALHAELRESGRALRAAADAQPADPAAVGAAFLELKSQREEIRAEKKALRNEISAVLTPEQRAELEGFLEGMRERGRARGAGFRGRRARD
jgi:periplasmic protein CpxP/Spy